MIQTQCDNVKAAWDPGRLVRDPGRPTQNPGRPARDPERPLLQSLTEILSALVLRGFRLFSSCNTQEHKQWPGSSPGCWLSHSLVPERLPSHITLLVQSQLGTFAGCPNPFLSPCDLSPCLVSVASLSPHDLSLFCPLPSYWTSSVVYLNISGPCSFVMS